MEAVVAVVPTAPLIQAVLVAVAKEEQKQHRVLEVALLEPLTLAVAVVALLLVMVLQADQE
jgi:hypothetical protein